MRINDHDTSWRWANLNMVRLLFVFALVAGCSQQPNPREQAEKNKKNSSPITLNRTLLSVEAVATVRRAVEQQGGTLQCDAEGQPVAIDLTAGRGSTDSATFEAALKCPRLKSFRARVGQISAKDLQKIAKLKELEELMLQDAAVTDAILIYFAQSLHGLRRLTLRNTPQVTDDGIAVLTNLSQLQKLALIDLQIGDKVLPTLAKFPALVSLDLRHCSNIRGAGLAFLHEAPRLKELKIGAYDIDDDTMAIVADLPHLEILSVEDSSITSSGIEKLTGNPLFAQRLRTLTFSRCSSLDDDALRSLALLGSLHRLTLRDVPVTGSFLTRLPFLSQLELLSLNETFLSEAAFEAIADCRNLKRLELVQNSLTPAALKTIATLANLEYLNLSECGLDDEMLKPLAGLQKLHTLIVEGNPNVSHETTTRLIESNDK